MVNGTMPITGKVYSWVECFIVGSLQLEFVRYNGALLGVIKTNLQTGKQTVVRK